MLSTNTYTTWGNLTLVPAPSVDMTRRQCPTSLDNVQIQLKGTFFRDYYLSVSVNEIMDHYHITSIVNYTNYIRRLIEQEDLDHSGVT